MPERYYLDTSIWRDYFEDRRDNMRPLGEFGFQFLQKCLQNNYEILVSDFVIHELGKYYPSARVKLVFAPFTEIIHFIDITPEDHREAAKLAALKMGSHYEDLLHAASAHRHGAILITRDKGFASIDFVQIKKPEEVIFD